MNVSFNGIGDGLVTFVNHDASRGAVVKVSASGTVAPCAAGDAFDGVAVYADDMYAGVQMGGFVTVAYSGTVPAVGRGILAANGNGGVKTAESGDTYLIVAQDTAAKTITIKL